MHPGGPIVVVFVVIIIIIIIFPLGGVREGVQGSILLDFDVGTMFPMHFPNMFRQPSNYVPQVPNVFPT